MRHVTLPKAADGIRGFSSRRKRPRMPSAALRNAFTLIELLVVIGIILLVAAITLSAVNLSISGDRIRGAARQTQSYLEGARSRAVYGGKIAAQNSNPAATQDAKGVGVRFIREPNSSLVSSFVYIQQVAPFVSTANNQTITIANDRRTISMATNTALNAIPQHLIPDIAEIQISDDATFETTDPWYWVVKNGWVLTTDYQVVGTGPFPGRHYKIRLLAEPMPDQEPRLLGNGAVIDLRHSRVPASWRTPLGWSDRLDLMFDSRGTISGAAAALGMMEFYVSDRQDAILSAPSCAPFWTASTVYNLNDMVAPSTGRTAFIYQATQVTASQQSGTMPPTWPTTAGSTVSDNNVTWTCVSAPDGCSSAKRERLVVSLMPQTGATAVHPIYVSLPSEDADPFRYAESGEVARQ